MENSAGMLFGKDTSQWYVAVGQKWIGPMSASDIYAKLVNHELTLAHYAWKKGQSEWKRICDIKTFQSLGPNQPGKKLTPGPKAGAAAKSPDTEAYARIWYLHQNQSQFGPFSTSEIQSFLKAGKIHPRIHGWRDGMKNWERLEKLSEFQDFLAAPVSSTEGKTSKKADLRDHPRRPLVAKILMSDQETVIVGVCRDISIGGLQVLTETVPGEVGTKIKMNISPSSDESGNPIQPFVAEGLIVRILEDGRGFSFRFTQLSDRAKQAIESYIESPS